MTALLAAAALAGLALGLALLVPLARHLAWRWRCRRRRLTKPPSLLFPR